MLDKEINKLKFMLKKKNIQRNLNYLHMDLQKKWDMIQFLGLK